MSTSTNIASPKTTAVPKVPRKPAKPRTRAKAPGPTPAPTPRKLTSTVASRIMSGSPVAAQVPAPSQPLTNHVAFIIDDSGSMQSIRDPLVRAFNQNLAAIKEEVYKNTTKDGKSDQQTTLTSVFFGNQVHLKTVAAPVDMVRSMQLGDYQPNGGTALLGAVGETIERLEQLPDAISKDTSFLLITLTDGQENASSDRWKTGLAEKMRRCQATDRWTFVFLVPSERDRDSLIRAYGIPDGNVRVWDTTTEGMKAAGDSVKRGISSFYTSRASGQSSVKGFFKADLSGVRKKDLNKLENLRDLGKVRVFTVKAEAEIKPFIETETGEAYVKGGAFYELVKDEKIQSYKKVAIMERADGSRGKVYGGDDARGILGLPDGQDVKVRIADLGPYRLFVQSTSVNRKLPRGTTVLYIPSIA